MTHTTRVKLPLAAVLEKKRALRARLIEGSHSRGFQHIFFAEHAANKVEGLPREMTRGEMGKSTVIGAGTMGGGISIDFLSAGMAVPIVEISEEALDRGVATIRKNYEATAAKGRITNEQVKDALNRLIPSLDLAPLASCDLIIEAADEDHDIETEIVNG